MRLTKMGHACVRLEKEGRALVIDPGPLSEPAAGDGAEAILITHEHWDHFDEVVLTALIARNPGVDIWTNGAVAARFSGPSARVHIVGSGDAFDAAGFDVRVHGEHHAVVHPEVPVIGNIGFLIDGAVFHPGDALTDPGQPLAALLLPVHAPWLRLGDAVDYARSLHSRNAFALHDGLLNEHGLAVTDRVVRSIGIRTTFTPLSIGQSVEIT